MGSVLLPSSQVCQLNTLPGKENQSVSLGAFGKIEWVSVTDEYNFEITITGGHPNYQHKDRWVHYCRKAALIPRSPNKRESGYKF